MPQDDQFANLLRSLIACGKLAAELKQSFLANLIAAAVIEAALQWEGGQHVLSNEAIRPDQVVKMKLRYLFGSSSDNVIPLFPQDN